MLTQFDKNYFHYYFYYIHDVVVYRKQNSEGGKNPKT